MSVYFATSGRYTKIGYSRDPFSRVSTITRVGARPPDVPFDAETTLLGWIPGDTRIEGFLHARFIEQRVEGEWFVIDEPVIRELIWADPGGVDVQRMSAAAVLTMDKSKGVTRDEVAAAGVGIEGVPLKASLETLMRPKQAAS